MYMHIHVCVYLSLSLYIYIYVHNIYYLSNKHTYLTYWIYGTDLFDGKEFAIDGATQNISRSRARRSCSIHYCYYYY